MLKFFFFQKVLNKPFNTRYACLHLSKSFYFNSLFYHHPPTTYQIDQYENIFFPLFLAKKISITTIIILAIEFNYESVSVTCRSNVERENCRLIAIYCTYNNLDNFQHVPSIIVSCKH